MDVVLRGDAVRVGRGAWSPVFFWHEQAVPGVPDGLIRGVPGVQTARYAHHVDGRTARDAVLYYLELPFRYRDGSLSLPEQRRTPACLARTVVDRGCRRVTYRVF